MRVPVLLDFGFGKVLHRLMVIFVFQFASVESSATEDRNITFRSDASERAQYDVPGIRPQLNGALDISPSATPAHTLQYSGPSGELQGKYDMPMMLVVEKKINPMALHTSRTGNEKFKSVWVEFRNMFKSEPSRTSAALCRIH